MKSIIKLTCVFILLLSGFLHAGEGNESGVSLADSSVATGSGAPDDSLSAVAGSNAEPPLYPITPERRELLNEYSTFKNIWRFAYNGYSWLVLLLICFCGVSGRLLKLASKVSSKKYVHFLIYIFLILLTIGVLTLPLDYYREYVVEHQYGFSNQSVGEWFIDSLKNFSITYAFALICLGCLFFLIKKYPRRWWVVFTVGSIPFMVFTIVIIPVVVAPMFNDFQPLQDKQLEAKILGLASLAGIEGSDVFEVNASKQSTKLNAYVTGLFGSKRIVLYDTTIEAMDEDELLFVMGHEMGHYVMHHIWLLVGMILVMLLFAVWLTSKVLPAVISRYASRFGFDRLGSYAATPLIIFALTFSMFFTQPVSNGLSRYFEHQSDIFGMDVTRYNAQAAAGAFEKLSAYNLSDPDPHPLIEFWFYSHPSLQKRIEFVRGYGK